MGLRVVITGATGNVGTSLISALDGDAEIEEIVAIARRPAELGSGPIRFVAADVAVDDLAPHFRGADVVVHLAWLIQPSRDGALLYAVNVEGSRRVFDAAVRAGVGAIVHASSVGAYSPGPKDAAIDESWPTQGIDSLFYARHKAAVERMLDGLEAEHPEIRVVRLRPGLIFKRGAATGIRRLFAGPLLPGSLLRPRLLPVLPTIEGLRFQVVHSLDVGQAYRRAVLRDVRGAFNIAADPVLDMRHVGELLEARLVEVPRRVARAAVDLAWRARLQPSPPGWLDMGLAVPTMSSERAMRELGWTPRHSAVETLGELLAGLREGGDEPTPPLARSTGGPLRVREFRRAAQPD